MKRYEAIYQDLEHRIRTNNYPRGDFLPSEKELQNLYQASRDTVRKALNLLTNSGYIQKIQGKGSIVLAHGQLDFPVSGLTSYKELVQAQSFKSQTKVILLKQTEIDDKLSRLTGFEIGTLVWELIRCRIIDDVPALIDKDYLLVDIVPNLTTKICENSIYDYLEHQLNLDISYAYKEITIEDVDMVDKKYLNLGQDKQIVSVKSKVFLGDARQFQFTNSRHKLSKFRFVDFARRKSIGTFQTEES
ncbi:MAG: trehalose operon repressor [Streptococcaceae bacterium]|jgi:GntR family trehalose operon transcriptional repressor|nr:trehalose operon repressor [Streptococcaceae bacterium]